MPFSIRNLSVLAYAQGFTLWHYKAGAASLGDAAQLGFFNDAIGMLAAGDMLMVTATDGGRILFVTAAQGHVATSPLG
jgi:hypothetical protein